MSDRICLTKVPTSHDIHDNNLGIFMDFHRFSGTNRCKTQLQHHQSVVFGMFGLRPTSTTTVPRLHRLRCLAPHRTWLETGRATVSRHPFRSFVSECFIDLVHLLADRKTYPVIPVFFVFPAASFPSKTGIKLLTSANQRAVSG